MKWTKFLLVAGIIAASIFTSFVMLFFERSTGIAETSINQECKSWKTESLQHLSTLITNTTCSRDYFLLILVSSAPGNFDRRSLIRQTWGAANSHDQWRTFFLLGQIRNQKLSDLLETEAKGYGDIIRGDYYEHYWNQSFKIEMGFEWAARYCNFSFLLKADDDVYVNTKDLTLLLQNPSTPLKRLYMGKVQFRAKVRRYGKFNVSKEEYSGSTYPSYCSGAGYVLSNDIVQCLIPLFDMKKPFRIDDIYVGLVVSKLGISPVHHSRFIFPNDDYDICYFTPYTLVQHRVLGQCLLKLYQMHSKEFYSSNLVSFY